MRTIMGAKAERGGKSGSWKVPATIASIIQIQHTFHPEELSFPNPEDLVGWEGVQDFMHRRAYSTHESGGEIRWHQDTTLLQNKGIGWLISGCGLLADQMGTGKTVQAAVAGSQIVHPEQQSGLVVTTKSTVGSWVNHLRKWARTEPVVLHGTPKQQEEAIREIEKFGGTGWVVTTHGMTLKHSALASFGSTPGTGEKGWLNRDWEVMIVDEFHKFRDPASKTARALAKIRQTSHFAWALTGTPIEDNPDDLWHVLNFAAPWDFPSRSRFRDRYCKIEPQFFGGIKNLGIRPEMEEEFTDLVDHYMLRRMRREVFPDLPIALDTDYRVIPMAPKQQAAYNKMAKHMVAQVHEDKTLITLDPVVLHSRLDNISSAMPVLDDDGKITHLTHPSNKAEALLDIAEERAGDPFIVFAPSRKLVEFLHGVLVAEGYSCGLITGAVPAPLRTAYTERFQEGKLDVMLMTSAGAEGLTLTAADLIVYADLDWSARTNQQVADRIDRKGQHRPPQRIVLLSEGTIDISRRYLVEMKEDSQQAILRDSDRFKDIVGGKFVGG